MYYKMILPNSLRLILFIAIACLLIVQSSCQKYLDKKPKQNLAVPSTLNDLEAVLNYDRVNGGAPADLETVADNYYLTTAAWNGRSLNERLNYIWDPSAQPTTSEVWNDPYFAVYQANFVLDQLPKIQINESDHAQYDKIKGIALFYRSFMFHQLAQLYCKPYFVTANTDPGIVLRLVSTVNELSTRATVEQTYNQIISDLKTAAVLLPEKSLFITRPNKAAAYGELARVYLSMRDYINAGKYADTCLILYNALLDYNTMTGFNTSNLPSWASNPEVLYLSYEGFASDLSRSQNQLIDSLLYQSYQPNDLRKTAFFGPAAVAGTYFWRGSYFNRISPSDIFDGLATDEIYLIRAESRARIGGTQNVADAIEDLNTLLRKRYKTGRFTDYVATTSDDALNKILNERRKELVFRGLRWSDLRRFNLEGANITLKRIINGASYTLPPGDPRWVLLIPIIEISRSGITQNPR